MPTAKKKLNGAVLYRGPSAIDGAPIVVLATGLARDSQNAKTGAMVQTWILREDIAPVAALRNGADASICGDCEHRPILAHASGAAPCYVNVGRAPTAVWNAYHAGAYPLADAADFAQIFSGRVVRFGAYGDPFAAPVELWESIAATCAGFTGYSHQWQNPGFDHARWAPLVMASADDIDGAALANLHGMRAFRVSTGLDVQPGEVLCPASAEAGARTTCAKCKLCAGTSKLARDIVIPDHAAGAAARARRVIPIGAMA